MHSAGRGLVNCSQLYTVFNVYNLTIGSTIRRQLTGLGFYSPPPSPSLPLPQLCYNQSSPFSLPPPSWRKLLNACQSYKEFSVLLTYILHTFMYMRKFYEHILFGTSIVKLLFFYFKRYIFCN